MNAMRVCLTRWIVLSLLVAGSGSAAWAKGLAEHVVLIVWDGMRPDFIRPQYTPSLSFMADNGVFFANHHPLYISSTEVNGTGLATGVYPDKSGIMANSSYWPEIGWQSPTGTESLEAIRRGDLLTGGHYLMTPTMAETLQQAGIRTVVAGTKPVALLHDRALKRTGKAATNSPVLYAGKTIPPTLIDAIVKANDDKTFPDPATVPNVARDEWTTRALLRTLWKKEVPKFTLLWLSDPDASQHANSPGSEQALAGIANVDRQLNHVLHALEDKKLLDKTDVFVVSDHGFSTIQRAPDVVDLLKKNGFRATRKFDDPMPGDVLVVNLGGSSMFYVNEKDEAVIKRLVAFMQTTDFAGVIFSRTPVEGTFPLDQVRLGLTNAPDLVVSYRWSAEKNEFGAPGFITSDTGTRGKGTHASLSPFDMHNTLVAMGPDFKRGFVNRLASGNIDVPSTILWILGVAPSVPMEGRVLSEALENGPKTNLETEQKTVEATADMGPFRWRQYLKFTRVGSVIYFDEGSGESTLR